MDRPGGPLSSRPLHFFWITDCSGSMASGGKIQSLNSAIREALPHMRRVAHENPNAQVLVRVLTFATNARWLTAAPVPIEQFTWTDLQAGGVTDLGRALTMVADALKVPPMSARALQPVLAVVSDGRPTDRFEEGLAELLRQPWGARSIRIAIAIGGDADHHVLNRFIGDPQRQPLTANNSAELVELIRWVSTAPVKLASSAAVAATAADLSGPPYIPTAVPATDDIAATAW
ncbi:tellurium resistance protein [Actinoplanes sp. TBRC 11911]|uniref:vWA domain-containing protein n=1 Tax=Actinoplanes sp. TBRC 11911 TaxID=2729386 RepID=UPI00145F87CC|nr:VWA domain-containing protein [Actinoplanes sp. TBRC 11911]NMO54285.1 tellurium resistance protein [Actinoplanes sp. TBRC 11911]